MGNYVFTIVHRTDVDSPRKPHLLLTRPRYRSDTGKQIRQ